MPDQVFWMLVGGIVVCVFWWLHYTAWRNSTRGETPSASHNTASDAIALAEEFHTLYEELAPKFGYDTRKESAVPWHQVPDKNRKLMVAVCERIIAAQQRT